MLRTGCDWLPGKVGEGWADLGVVGSLVGRWAQSTTPSGHALPSLRQVSLFLTILRLLFLFVAQSPHSAYPLITFYVFLFPVSFPLCWLPLGIWWDWNLHAFIDQREFTFHTFAWKDDYPQVKVNLIKSKLLRVGVWVGLGAASLTSIKTEVLESRHPLLPSRMADREGHRASTHKEFLSSQSGIPYFLWTSCGVCYTQKASFRIDFFFNKMPGMPKVTVTSKKLSSICPDITEWGLGS